MSTPPNASLGIPPSTTPLKLPAIQKLSSGSATGNPRNKCALKPGHSLMDWIRLGNSGYDLSGTKGAIIPVNHAELSKHCTQNDAWMAIRGKVYNVTKYMDFHPGGPEELMRGVGKDATKLFDQVHAWVNYDQLLKKCLIGPLRNVVKIDADFLRPTIGDARPSVKPATTPKAISPEIIPRFDWIQKQTTITIYFYTKQFCNPGLVLTRKSDKNIVVRVFIENNCHLYDIDLHAEIKWPPTVAKVSSETGKIEIALTKSQAELWPEYGTSKASKEQQIEDLHCEFTVVENQKINHNSHGLRLRCKDVIVCVSVGYHMSFSCQIGGQEVSRSYTSVPRKYTPFTEGDVQDLYFLLKTYDDGVLAKHVNSLEIGSQFGLSQQKGSLCLSHLLGHTKIALLAAGSGITPMLGLIEHLLVRNASRIENLVLIYFNKTEDDIWCRTQLEDLTQNEERFHLINVLSQPDKEWSGLTGHISSELLSTLKEQSSQNYSTFVCTCGPSIFNNLAESILKTLGFEEPVMHFFSG